MPVDPQIQPMIDASAEMMALDTAALTPEMLRVSAAQAVLPFALPDIAAVSDHSVDGPNGPVPVRLYRPEKGGVLPAILFLHGGGWVMGTIEQYEAMARGLALQSGCALLSVEYRLAPEHPYPAGLEDSYAALEWLAKDAAKLGIDPERIAIAGDSAGGNLAAAVALLARDRNGPSLRHQLLLYPVTDRGCDTPSYHENDRYLLAPDMMRWFWKQYIGDRSAAETPLASPLEFSDLTGLPPATVITAEYDPLRDEGEAYAIALARHGVPTELVRAPGMIHGFVAMAGLVDASTRMLSFAAKRVAASLDGSVGKAKGEKAGKLAGKVAIVTGAAQGMGETTARLFAAEGATVALVDRLENGAEVARSIGDSASFHCFDITDQAEWERLRDDLLAKHGHIDVLVNNAAIEHVADVLSIEKADFERVLNVNLLGSFLGLKVMGSQMASQGKGSIVNILSVGGLHGINGLGTYVSSKWGLRGLTRTAAMELGHRGVRVNGVYPGGIATPMSGVDPDSEENRYLFARLPLGRMGLAEEVANASLFLASDDASYIAGVELPVDGGQMAGRFEDFLPGGPELLGTRERR